MRSALNSASVFGGQRLSVDDRMDLTRKNKGADLHNQLPNDFFNRMLNEEIQISSGKSLAIQVSD